MDQEAIWEHFQNDGLANFDEARARLQFLARRVRPHERVLNIGVGAGAFEELAAAKDAEVWALDPSQRTIEKLRERLALGERAQAGYSEDPPFPSDHFDVVVMSEVLEHLDRATFDATLRQVRRMLRPGGRFIGTVPARERLELSDVVCPHCRERFHRWGHQLSFDVAALTKLLSGEFHIDTVREVFFTDWDSVTWSRRLAGLLKKLLSWRGVGPYGIGRNIYFCVRKDDSGETPVRTANE